MNNEEYYRNEDEIDLSELVGVLFRRWRAIIVVTCIITIIGVTYSFIKTKKYETHASIKVGVYQNTSGNYTFIQSPQAASENLRSIAEKIFHQDYSKAYRKRLAFDIKNDFKAEVTKASGIIKLTLTSSEKFDSVSFINKIYSKFRAICDKRFQQISQRKNLLKKQIKQSSDRIDTLLKAQRSVVGSPKEPIALLLFNNEIKGLRIFINNLQTKANNLKKISKTSFAINPYISDIPVSPNYKLFFAISLVLGLFLGIFVAFLREFWINNKEKILGKSKK